MAGAGTDKTKNWVVAPGPVVVLVEPQLGENIGAAARSMANFGLAQLRLVKPRDGWPNERARWTASGADRVLDEAQVFDTLEAALADCTLALATTARAHDQAKPVHAPEQAARALAAPVAAGETAAIVFGRERWGLTNVEVGLADAIVTFPVNPAFASLNLAQAVALMSYEWFKLASAGALPFVRPERSPPAPKQQLFAFFATLERELDRIEFFRPADKRSVMVTNLRNIVTRMDPTQQDIQTLHGVVTALAAGRKGSADGGVLNGVESERLRALVNADPRGVAPSAGGPVRGLARLLRRNPTDAERTLWEALTTDRRLAGRFKRQAPVGPYAADFVSFGDRVVLDVIPAEEDAGTAGLRAEKHAWLEARRYRVLPIAAAALETDRAAVIDRIAGMLSQSSPTPDATPVVDPEHSASS